MIDARIQKAFPGGRGSAPFELKVSLKSAADVTVLFGPSGAGKSLTLDCIAGFIRPDEGRILVNDRLLFLKRIIKNMDNVRALTNPPLLFDDPGLGAGDVE